MGDRKNDYILSDDAIISAEVTALKGIKRREEAGQFFYPSFPKSEGEGF
jgi:hypothetical protein